MKKIILLITISLALIATIIIAGVLFNPISYTEPGNSTANEGQAFNKALQISTVNPTTEPEFFTFGDEYGQAIFVELSTGQQANQSQNYTLVTAPVGLEIQPENNIQALCSESGVIVVAPPPGTMTTFDNGRTGSIYLERLADLFDLPLSNQYIITMWYPTTQTNDYTLVSAQAAGDTGECPYLLDEDV